MRPKVLVAVALAVLGVAALASEAQAQSRSKYRPGYRPNQGGTYKKPNYGDYGRSPRGRPQTPPRYTPAPVYRQPSPYRPGGSLYSPFNMGQHGSGNHSHAPRR